MREKRPGHIVLRASKVFASSRWDGRDYSVAYQTSAEMMKYLEELPVGLVLIDDSGPNLFRHHALLKETLLKYPDRWELLGTYPLTKAGIEYGNALLLYRLRGHETQPRRKIQLNMNRMLGGTIVEESR
jgi:hypothetical protein